MEDISRELEKELAQSRPKPYKKDRVTRVLIIDDFGLMKSGEYLKTLVRIFSIISLICFISTAVLFKLYMDLSKMQLNQKMQLVEAQNKVEKLSKEKEVLMARLIIHGKEPLVSENQIFQTGEASETKKSRQASTTAKKDLKTETKSGVQDAAVTNMQKKEEDGNAAVASAVNPVKPSAADQDLSSDGQSKAADMIMQNSDFKNKIVAIEKFKVTKDGNNSDLLVRFNIRNISQNPGDVSGRIFTVLKPENKSEKQWLVVPASELENGIPVEYRKGQYFSIAHFKPVKFRIKTSAPRDFFKQASIYIFDGDGNVVAEKLIDITDEQ